MKEYEPLQIVKSTRQDNKSMPEEIYVCMQNDSLMEEYEALQIVKSTRQDNKPMPEEIYVCMQDEKYTNDKHEYIILDQNNKEKIIINNYVYLVIKEKAINKHLVTNLIDRNLINILKRFLKFRTLYLLSSYFINQLVDDYCNILIKKIGNNNNGTKLRLGGYCLPGYFDYLVAKKLKKLKPDLEIELTTYATPLQQYLPLIDGVKWVQYYNPRDKVVAIASPFICHPNYSIVMNSIAAAYLTLFVASIYIHLQISLSISSLVIVFFSGVLFFRIFQYLTLTQKSRATLVPNIISKNDYNNIFKLHWDVWKNLLDFKLLEDPSLKLKNNSYKYKSLPMIVSKAFFIPDNNNIKDVKFIDNQINIELQDSLEKTALALKNQIIKEQQDKPIWLIGHGKGGHIAKKAAELLYKEQPKKKINLVTIATALQQWEKTPSNVKKWYKFHNRYDLTQKVRAFFASHEKYSKHSYLIYLVIEIFIVQICNIYSFNISILAALLLFVAIMFLHRFLEYNLIYHDNASVHVPAYSFDIHNSIQNSCTQDRIAEHIICDNYCFQC